MPKRSFFLKGAVCSHSAFCLKKVGLLLKSKITISDTAGISIWENRILIVEKTYTIAFWFFVNHFETHMPQGFNMQICNEYEKMDPEARSVLT